MLGCKIWGTVFQFVSVCSIDTFSENSNRHHPCFTIGRFNFPALSMVSCSFLPNAVVQTFKFLYTVITKKITRDSAASLKRKPFTLMLDYQLKILIYLQLKKFSSQGITMINEAPVSHNLIWKTPRSGNSILNAVIVINLGVFFYIWTHHIIPTIITM